MTGSRDTATIIGLPRWKFFLPSVLLWALFVSSAAQSATLKATYPVYPGVDTDFNSTGNLGNNGPYYYGLDVIGSDAALTTLVKLSSTPTNTAPHTVTYSLAEATPLPSGEFEPNDLIWFATSNDSLTALLAASEQYILRIGCVACANVKNNLSAVPLPAAAWLFGSALVGFIMMSNRRSV